MTTETTEMTAPAPATFDIFIGGFFDWYSGIVAGYQKTFRQRYPQRAGCYFEHGQHSKIIAAAKTALSDNPDTVFNLIGHSWGATSALKMAADLARQGCTVHLVISVDPVRPCKKASSPATTKWININAVPATSNGWKGDHFATLGGKWANWPSDKAACHYPAPCHHNEFCALFEYTPPGGISALNRLLASGHGGRQS